MLRVPSNASVAYSLHGVAVLVGLLEEEHEVFPHPNPNPNLALKPPPQGQGVA